jgi:hypothetical protein
LLERRQVVAAVVHERRGILKHDFVVVRKPIRPEQIALSDFDAVDPQLPRRQIQQPFADEHAMLPARASNRRHDRLVREHRREFGVVVWNVVRAEQRALRVDGNRQAVRIVGARIAQKPVRTPRIGRPSTGPFRLVHCRAPGSWRKFSCDLRSMTAA